MSEPTQKDFEEIIKTPDLTDDIIDDSPVIEEAIIAESEVKPAIDEPVRPEQHVTVSESWTQEATRWDPDADTVVMPSNHDKETRQAIQLAPKIDHLDNPTSRKWANTINDGLALTTLAEGFVPTLENEQADFRQGVETTAGLLNGREPKYKPLENQNLEGTRAIIRVMSYLGLGTLFQTPLWHTGIWLTFKAPSEDEIIELNRQLISEKIRFGRDTYGMVFSNVTSFTIDRLVSFALEHVYDSTLKSELVGTRNLMSVISTQDIPTLLWGFACTMYPKGFQYQRACINDPEKCNHVVEEILNLIKLLWVNNTALTDWQKTHMSNRVSASKDLPSIERYKEELLSLQKTKVSLETNGDKTISFTLRTPTIQQYVEAGYRWITSIVDRVEKATSTDVSEIERDRERNNYVIRHAQASTMRQYVHWVESIEMGTNIIDDTETIESLLTVLSSDNTIRNSFIGKVVDYINNSTIAVIGIPVYDCPKCKTEQSSEQSVALPHHTNIIPLDVIQVFFALVSQRLERLTER